MAAISLFWDINMAAVTSVKTIYCHDVKWRQPRTQDLYSALLYLSGLFKLDKSTFKVKFLHSTVK